MGQGMGAGRCIDEINFQRRHFSTGGDVAGALQLLPEDQEPIETRPIADQLPAPLEDVGTVRVLDALPTRPLLAGQEGPRLSLAGAQSKVPVVLIDGHVALPLPGQA